MKRFNLRFRDMRWLLACALGFGGWALLAASGCADRQTVEGAMGHSATTADLEPDALATLIDQVLADELDGREMDVHSNAAWQLLHAVLVYQDDFLVPRPDDPSQKISFLKYLLEGGTCRGWDLEPVVFGNHRGLRFVLDVENQTGNGLGSMRGQGHPDQWLANLAQSRLPLEQTIRVGAETFTISEALNQAKLDVPFNHQQEYSWTLIAFTTYLPTSASWTASDGHMWSISRLVGIEADHELRSSACGGTHRLIGLATAVRRHKLQNGAMDQNWQRAQDVIDQSIARAREYQNADGSLSAQYLSRPGWTPDLVQSLGATGHMLEFLSIALPEDQLPEPWVRRVVQNVCDSIIASQGQPMECGAFYHALHGLALYRERAFPSQGEPRFLLPGPK